LPIGVYEYGGELYLEPARPSLPKKQKRGENASRGRRHGNSARRMGLDPSLLSND
jgi:hypothetical protein